MEETKSIDTEDVENSSVKKKNKAALVLNIITAAVLIFAVVFLIEAFYAKKNLHNNYFGHAILPVASKSMDNGKSGAIKKGDMIFVKILKEESKKKLEVEDIITFKYYIAELEAQELVTHRIIGTYSEGYITRGDANTNINVEYIPYEDIVGVYKGKIGGIGSIGLFFETKAGSFIMIVVPFILLLALTLFNFLRSVRVYNKNKIDDVTESTRAAVLSEEKERIRQELLREMESEKEQKERIKQEILREMESEKQNSANDSQDIKDKK